MGKLPTTLDLYSYVDISVQADEVMQMLSRFVEEFEKFMFWIKQQPAESEESIKWFEDIFSVTPQTHLLRNIQDIKDELSMLEAVFEDQVEVLLAAGEEIEQANFQCVHGCVVNLAVQQKLRCPHSSKAFVDQSSKHLKHIQRMQAQASQAYDTVSFPTFRLCCFPLADYHTCVSSRISWISSSSRLAYWKHVLVEDRLSHPESNPRPLWSSRW